MSLEPAAHPRVAVVMGSASDHRVMVGAVDVLTDLGVDHEVRVLSAHRTPHDMIAYGDAAAERGIQVIVAGAGGAAHLPGMLAAATRVPVIGVPIGLAHLDGVDSLLSIAQMPAGVPVATVAIDGARNAGHLAARILALGDPEVAERVDRHRHEMAESSRASNTDL
ncbi:MAG TPA: 5-(carboxyamino)imidazole ribonucleotide mutase [Acidimicrobiales bacterium]|nr:5-(carboxyamino)imidazole ribonucleotide mutase [Acidimicrobiales bacterium]